MQLEQIPITSLKGVGDKMAEKLNRLGLSSVQDLLFHLPLRYEDRTRVYPINELLPGLHVCIDATVMSSAVTFGRRRMLMIKVADDSGSMTLRFFNFNAGQKNSMSEGRRILAYGEIRRGQSGYEIIHPEYKLADNAGPMQMQDSLTPMYPTTEGLRQLTLRSLTDQALTMMQQHGVDELLPEQLYPHQLSLQTALQAIHRPEPESSLADPEAPRDPAQLRLVLEELIAQGIAMQQLRREGKVQGSVAIRHQNTLAQQLLAGLAFNPTGAQQRVVEEIRTDLSQPHPMMRLVQGDVGSGKTLVAALAATDIIEAGYQVGLMAPTEILAEQHALNFSQWLEPLGVKVGWLAGKQKGKARQAALEGIADGSTQMVVGTHAIFQESVKFCNLALVIVDEQHRFGVHQRLALREKGQDGLLAPHQLIMTATPIPRTLAMTAYADLDTSIIDELPPGRTPITTVAIPDSRRPEIVERVRQVVESEDRQAYWVCTLIEESDVLEAQAAEDTATELQQMLPGLRIGLVHGRMKPDEKQWVMTSFKQRELDLLVATTVIEVGVDIPNASLMIIENPERLGLAQLHQLRGRVGRGNIASHCVLLYHAPLSKTATQRLGVLRDSNDGFVIAQKDLEIRGPGELLGSRQTGIAELRIADLSRDQDLLPLAQRLSLTMLQRFPQQSQHLLDRWMRDRDIYSNA